MPLSMTGKRIVEMKNYNAIKWGIVESDLHGMNGIICKEIV